MEIEKRIRFVLDDKEKKAFGVVLEVLSEMNENIDNGYNDIQFENTYVDDIHNFFSALDIISICSTNIADYIGRNT